MQNYDRIRMRLLANFRQWRLPNNDEDGAFLQREDLRLDGNQAAHQGDCLHDAYMLLDHRCNDTNLSLAFTLSDFTQLYGIAVEALLARKDNEILVEATNMLGHIRSQRGIDPGNSESFIALTNLVRSIQEWALTPITSDRRYARQCVRYETKLIEARGFYARLR